MPVVRPLDRDERMILSRTGVESRRLIAALIMLTALGFGLRWLWAQRDRNLDAQVVHRALDDFQVALDERWSYRHANGAEDANRTVQRLALHGAHPAQRPGHLPLRQIYTTAWKQTIDFEANQAAQPRDGAVAPTVSVFPSRRGARLRRHVRPFIIQTACRFCWRTRWLT